MVRTFGAGRTWVCGGHAPPRPGPRSGSGRRGLLAGDPARIFSRSACSWRRSSSHRGSSRGVRLRRSCNSRSVRMSLFQLSSSRSRARASVDSPMASPLRSSALSRATARSPGPMVAGSATSALRERIGAPSRHYRCITAPDPMVWHHRDHRHLPARSGYGTIRSTDRGALIRPRGRSAPTARRGTNGPPRRASSCPGVVPEPRFRTRTPLRAAVFKTAASAVPPLRRPPRVAAGRPRWRAGRNDPSSAIADPAHCRA